MGNKVRIVVEVPRGGLVKRREDGRVDYVSPVPCPFNYGSVLDRPAADGDLQDVVLLGPALPRGHVALAEVRAIVRFVDGGLPDDKWVCADREPTGAERRLVIGFFRLYAGLKRLTGRDTRFLGWEDLP